MTVSQLGPISYAELSFGGLTVIVGPQATGKTALEGLDPPRHQVKLP